MIDMNEWTFEELYEGQCASVDVLITAEAIASFAQLSGDKSPIHVDRDYARSRNFPDCVAHGALVTGYVSQVIGMYLPGRLGLLQKLEMQFRKPCFAGDQLRITAIVTRKIESVHAIHISISVEDAVTGDVIANGKIQSGIAVQHYQAA